MNLCANCGIKWGADEFVPLYKVKNILIRVSPGEIFPSGECPVCGALTHREEDVGRMYHLDWIVKTIIEHYEQTGGEMIEGVKLDLLYHAATRVLG